MGWRWIEVDPAKRHMDQHNAPVSRVRGTQYSLELFTCDRRIFGERLVDVNDDGREDGEEETESDDDHVPDGHVEGGFAAEVGILTLEFRRIRPGGGEALHALDGYEGGHDVDDDELPSAEDWGLG